MTEMSRIEGVRMEADAASRTSTARPGRKIAKRAVLALALLAGTALAGRFGYDYWTHGRFLESTDDAYVQADYTTVAPKVSGYISDVLVRDNQKVTAGQMLARIDDRDFRAALDQARANVAAAQAAVRNLDAQASLQQAEIDQARAVITATRASLDFAEADAARYHNLMRSGAGTTQEAQLSQSSREKLTAQLQSDEAALVAAQRKITVLQTARGEQEANADHARAALHQAQLNLGYTTITAPVSGTVGARTLRVGQYVQAGTQLMAVVPLDAAYVVANFKETQLDHVRAGEKVEVEVDGLPDARISGHVDSLAPASGLEFALLPPDNATGNFTKIVQRIPVKIVLDDAAAEGVLRPGMSVEPTIDTKGWTTAGESRRVATRANPAG